MEMPPISLFLSLWLHERERGGNPAPDERTTANRASLAPPTVTTRRKLHSQRVREPAAVRGGHHGRQPGRPAAAPGQLTSRRLSGAPRSIHVGLYMGAERPPLRARATRGLVGGHLRHSALVRDGGEASEGIGPDRNPSRQPEALNCIDIDRSAGSSWPMNQHVSFGYLPFLSLAWGLVACIIAWSPFTLPLTRDAPRD